MGYRLRVVPEVEVRLRDIDPVAAGLVDDALNTLREAGAGLGPPDIRILFTVEHAVDHHPDTALLLAAGTERDWLYAWYVETLIYCRTRYERDRASAG